MAAVDDNADSASGRTTPASGELNRCTAEMADHNGREGTDEFFDTDEITPPPPAVPRQVAEIAAAIVNAPSVPAPITDTLPNVPGYEILGLLGSGGMGVIFH